MEKSFDRAALFSPATLLIALVFGLIGTLTLWANMRIPSMWGSDVAADVREIFVVLGAALTGPVGGAIAGLVSTIYSPAPAPVLHASTMIAHSLAGMVLGWTFMRVRPTHATFDLFVKWFGCISLYYLTLVFSFLALASLLAPSWVNRANTSDPSWMPYVLIAYSALPELFYTLLITSVVMLALPIRYRFRLWRISHHGVDKIKDT